MWLGPSAGNHSDSPGHNSGDGSPGGQHQVPPPLGRVAWAKEVALGEDHWAGAGEGGGRESRGHSQPAPSPVLPLSRRLFLIGHWPWARPGPFRGELTYGNQSQTLREGTWVPLY